MKTVHELSREQLDELKGRYLTDKMMEHWEEPSYGEIAAVSSDVTDEEVFAKYEGTMFSDDDFSCTAGESGATPAPPDSANPPKTIDTWVMECAKGQYLHINATEDDNGTWFDFTQSIWSAYRHDLDELKYIALGEFSDFEKGYPKFHHVKMTCEVLETVEED